MLHQRMEGQPERHRDIKDHQLVALCHDIIGADAAHQLCHALLAQLCALQVQLTKRLGLVGLLGWLLLLLLLLLLLRQSQSLSLSLPLLLHL